MLTFATLFLGLAFGLQDVALVVDGEPHRIELRLGDEVVATLEEEPWVVEVDFGREPLQQELVATAFDEQGNVLGQARQWLNVTRPSSEVRLRLVERGPPPIVALHWESSVGSEVRRLRLSLDGHPVAAEDVRRIVLPALNLNEVHVLHAELELEGDTTAETDLVFGGRWGAEVETQLSAIPLQLHRRREPTLEEVQAGLRTVDGRPLAVTAIDRGAGELFVVRDPAAVGPFLELVRRTRQSPGGSRTTRTLRRTLGLKSGQLITFLWPHTRRQRGQQMAFDLFPVHGPIRKTDVSLWTLLSILGLDETQEFDPKVRLADAVTVAGLGAAEHGRPRAVLLVTAADSADQSRLDADRARRFLERIGVPFVAWSVDRPSPKGWDAQSVDSLVRFSHAAAELGRLLDRQRIVWVEGFQPLSTVTWAGSDDVEIAR